MKVEVIFVILHNVFFPYFLFTFFIFLVFLDDEIWCGWHLISFSAHQFRTVLFRVFVVRTTVLFLRMYMASDLTLELVVVLQMW